MAYYVITFYGQRKRMGSSTVWPGCASAAEGLARAEKPQFSEAWVDICREEKLNRREFRALTDEALNYL